ncbi:MAG: hypothetical protein J6A59_03800 [Lachnospiraceae bacterium]|nr:hypothetical protein [Lachnospiraceae bacterium]
MSNFDVVYRNMNGQPVPFIVEKRSTKVKAEPVKVKPVKAEPVKAKKKGGKKNV